MSVVMRARRHKGHPVLFALAVGTGAVAIVHGAVFVAVMMVLAAWWLLRR